MPIGMVHLSRVSTPQVQIHNDADHQRKAWSARASVMYLYLGMKTGITSSRRAFGKIYKYRQSND